MLAGTGVPLDALIPSSQANILWQHMTALHGVHGAPVMSSPLPPSLLSFLAPYLTLSPSLPPSRVPTPAPPGTRL